MSRKIDAGVIDNIVTLIRAGKNDSEIANDIGVSVSFVNKLRNKLNNLKTAAESEKTSVKNSLVKDGEPENYVVEESGAINDIQLLELRIKALERTIAFYKELIEFKKKQK